MYGDKVILHNGAAPSQGSVDGRVRGWFPRKCAIDVEDAAYHARLKKKK